MNYLKKIGFSLGIGLVITLFFTFLNTILNYFDLYSYSVYSIIDFVIVIISCLFVGFINGTRSSKKGWLEGLKLSGIVIGLMLILNLIIDFNFNYKTIIYYLIIIGLIVGGSIIGIQKKKN